MGAAQSEEEGLEPTKEWVKDLVDEIIADEFGSPDLELAWLSEDDNDAGKSEAALESRVKLGAVTLNEMRDSLGLDPYANAAADRPMVLTATGYVPIEANAGGNGDHTQTISAVQKYNADEPRVPKGNPGAGRWTGQGGDAARTRAADASEHPSQPDQAASDAEPGVQVAAGTGGPGYPIDLQQEETPHGIGHTIERHVGKSEEYLLSRLSDQLQSIQALGDTARGLKGRGSFSSLQAANDLVNATVDDNRDKVDLVIGGLSPIQQLDKEFGYPTGYEAFAERERSTPFIRETYSVRVIIVRDQNSARGYGILTAYPTNSKW